MSTAETTWQPKYLLGELQPGDTHFVKGADWHAVQSYLSFLRRVKGMLTEAKIVVKESRSGAIIRRLA